MKAKVVAILPDRIVVDSEDVQYNLNPKTCSNVRIGSIGQLVWFAVKEDCNIVPVFES